MSLNSISSRGEDNGRGRAAYRGIFAGNAVALGEDDDLRRQTVDISEEEKARRVRCYARVAAAKLLIPMDGAALAIGERLPPLEWESVPEQTEPQRTVCRICGERQARRDGLCGTCHHRLMERGRGTGCVRCGGTNNPRSLRGWSLESNGDRVCPECIEKGKLDEQEADAGMAGEGAAVHSDRESVVGVRAGRGEVQPA